MRPVGFSFLPFWPFFCFPFPFCFGSGNSRYVTKKHQNVTMENNTECVENVSRKLKKKKANIIISYILSLVLVVWLSLHLLSTCAAGGATVHQPACFLSNWWAAAEVHTHEQNTHRLALWYLCFFSQSASKISVSEPVHQRTQRRGKLHFSPSNLFFIFSKHSPQNRARNFLYAAHFSQGGSTTCCTEYELPWKFQPRQLNHHGDASHFKPHLFIAEFSLLRKLYCQELAA